MRYYVEWNRYYEAWTVDELAGTLPPTAYGPYANVTEAFRSAKNLAGWHGELP